MNCYCCSQKPFHSCCAPFIQSNQLPATADELMRSRFSAYCVADYHYIVDTYSRSQREQLTTDDIKESAAGIKWFALQASAPFGQASDHVEFKAWHLDNKKTALLHETSVFVREGGAWKYDTGTIHSDSGPVKIGRNDVCPCNSGKKFKQCCMRLA